MFWRVMLPLTRPALVTVVLINSVHFWNELLLAVTMVTEPTLRTLPAAMMMFGVMAAYLLHEVRTGGVVLVGTVFALYSYVDRISGLFYRFAYRYSDIVRQKTDVENAELLCKP